MAYDANTNQVFLDRMKNLGGGFANLHEEAKRIIDIYNQEANGNAAFADVDGITTTEVGTFISFLTDFVHFWEGGGVGELNIARWGQALPFYNQQQA